MIVEALVATALGLFTAIPAVLAYNRFARDIDRLATRQETFIEEFTNILQRNLGAPAPASPAAARIDARPKEKRPCPPSSSVAVAAAPSMKSTWFPSLT